MAAAAVRLPARRFSCEAQQVWHVSLSFAALLFNKAPLAAQRTIATGPNKLATSFFCNSRRCNY